MGRPGFDPWVGKIPWEGECYPLQYSGLEKSMELDISLNEGPPLFFHDMLYFFFDFSNGWDFDLKIRRECSAHTPPPYFPEAIIVC